MGLPDASQQCNLKFLNVKGKIILQITSLTHMLHSYSIMWNISTFSKQFLLKWKCHQEMQASRRSFSFSEIILSALTPSCCFVSEQEVF